MCKGMLNINGRSLQHWHFISAEGFCHSVLATVTLFITGTQIFCSLVNSYSLNCCGCKKNEMHCNMMFYFGVLCFLFVFTERNINVCNLLFLTGTDRPLHRLGEEPGQGHCWKVSYFIWWIISPRCRK